MAQRYAIVSNLAVGHTQSQMHSAHYRVRPNLYLGQRYNAYLDPPFVTRKTTSNIGHYGVDHGACANV
jgi:hypothetical protein